MELCQNCPMRDERYEPSSAGDKREIRELRNAIASLTDFIEYLFDKSEHLDHTTYTEVYEEYEQWYNKEQTDKRSVATTEPQTTNVDQQNLPNE